MPSPHEITPGQLSRLIGTPNAPVVVDLRIDADFDADPRTIPTAFRWPFGETAALAARLAGQPAVLYCQKGRKISQGTAAMLRSEGLRAETLEGGQIAWIEAGLPTIDPASLPLTDAGGRTVWVTRHRPKIDRIACPWLIRRFIDPRARFLFVPPEDVDLVAQKFSATPFDIEGARFSHRGERCSFDAILQEVALSIPALDTVATIVRGADTDRHDLAPQAAGLMAMSLGLSRMYRDDHAQLEAGLLLYDALYRWARDASDEGHDWPAPTSRP